MSGDAPAIIGSNNSGAHFSACGGYRYSLWRRWVDNCPLDRMVAFIGLNPSTADEIENDPTIRRCIGFAKSWGFDGLVMLNLFAFRATDPDVMKAVTNPVGDRNDHAITYTLTRSGGIVCAWGTHGKHRARDFEVKWLLRGAACPVWHLGKNGDGTPKHPLYLKANSERAVWL